MQVMITGCAGFIGSHTVETFIKNGHKVVGIDSLTYASNRKNMSTFIDKIDFYEKNICNTSEILRIVKKHNIEWIINFAAESHVDNSIKSCSEFIDSNISGTDSLLRVCKEESINILHISTDEVYGSKKEGSSKEVDVLDPQNPYSATKAAAEHLVRAYANTFKINAIIVRMSNNFGPRQHKEKLVPTIIKSLMSRKKIPVYGDGKNIRDWFYVKDCANMVYTVFSKGFFGETYNLTNKNEMTNLEIIDMICTLCDKDTNKNLMFVKDRPGHDFRYAISNNKVKKLGIEESTDFKEAISETIDFYFRRK